MKTISAESKEFTKGDFILDMLTVLVSYWPKLPFKEYTKMLDNITSTFQEDSTSSNSEA